MSAVGNIETIVAQPPSMAAHDKVLVDEEEYEYAATFFAGTLLCARDEALTGLFLQL